MSHTQEKPQLLSKDSKRPNTQLPHLLTHKLKAMADVIPEKNSLLLKLALGLFLFSNLCSPPEASSRLLGTEGAPDSKHRRPTWDSEAGVHLRLCYYSPWKGSKLSEDLWGQSLSGTGISKGILLSEVEIAGESCKNPGTPWMAGKAELRNALAVSGAFNPHAHSALVGPGTYVLPASHEPGSKAGLV